MGTVKHWTAPLALGVAVLGAMVAGRGVLAAAAPADPGVVHTAVWHDLDTPDAG